MLITRTENFSACAELGAGEGGARFFGDEACLSCASRDAAEAGLVFTPDAGLFFAPPCSPPIEAFCVLPLLMNAQPAAVQTRCA